MNNPIVLVIAAVLIGSLVIATSILIVFHYEFSVAANPQHIVVFRGNRWTGGVTLCGPADPHNWDCSGSGPPKPAQ